MSKANYQVLLVIVSLVLSLSSHAQQYAMDSDEGLDGKELFAVCAFCHGSQGQGGPALDAPSLAGMEAWYVEAQLNAFRQRIRGMHPEDVPGLQMSIVSGMARNAATIKNVAAYIESLPVGVAPDLTAKGEVAGTARPFIWRSKYAKLEHPEVADVNKGRVLYASCGICHGNQAEGNKILRAPKLTDLEPEYLHRQLQYFKDGLRGQDPRDTYGVQMAAFAKLLPDEQAIADVVAYIDSIEVQK